MDSQYVSIVERIAKLEQALDHEHRAFAFFQAESRKDQEMLREVVTALRDVVEARHHRQAGFLAGILFIGSIFGALLATAWHKFLDGILSR